MHDSRPLTRSGATAVDPRASAFVEARLAGRSIAAYPGDLPATLEQAYAIQSQAIHRWPDEIAGWKVGRINPPWDAQLGTDRLAGPIFSRQIVMAAESASPIFLFQNGFGAVEGEVIVEVGEDAPAGKLDWTLDEAKEIAANLRVGVEIASSPFAEINDHGPLVTISDFGNNNGLVLGAEIPGWRDASPSDWKFRTSINGVEVGAADAMSVPGGPFESLRALLEICARRNLPLKRGMHISTGAVTGVHVIAPGQSTLIEMAGLPAIACYAERAIAPPVLSNLT